MSYTMPYHRKSFRPELDAMIPGNKTADNPVEFDLAPAWGADKARIKSIVYATLGLAQDAGWDARTQDTVIKAFETGAAAFVNTVEAVRGLSVPAIMAVRAGLLAEVPLKADPENPKKKIADDDALFPILTGAQFSRVAGAMPALALAVAMEIVDLQGKVVVDGRFTQPRSGSGIAGTRAKRTSTAASARKRPSAAGTAASPAPTDS